MDLAIYLAYDGSINGDWVARYAIRLTGNTPARQLTLLHIDDKTIPAARLTAKLEDIA